MQKKYGIKYVVESGQFTREELVEEGAGGCDAIIIISIMRDHKPAHSGPLSVKISSLDGVPVDGKDLADMPDIPITEMFVVWSMIAKSIAESDESPEWQRAIASQTFTDIREWMAPDGTCKDRRDPHKR